MTHKKALQIFAKQVTNKNWHITKSFMWCINLKDTIYYCEDEGTEGAEAFRVDFINKYPYAENYSDALLSILHEIGHFYTRNQMDYIYPESYDYNEYFQIHDELIATNWAIQWLKNKNNLQLIQQFEYNWRNAN